MEELQYRLEFMSYGKRIILLWGAFIVCLLFVTIITSWIGSVISNLHALIFISSAIQNICVFMLPAVLTAYYITPRPFALLNLDSKPGLTQVLLVLVVMVVSMPALNYLVHLNESVDLPDSAIEDWLRNTEAAARAVTDKLLEVDSVGLLMVSVLVIGILTGFCEEVFFRGTQQQIFLLRGINGHVAVWFTAILFSALHFQFYGFFPRLLLGAFFGYLVWKGGSLWLPVIAHAFNNSVTVVFGYISKHDSSAFDFNTVGVPCEGGFPVLALVSLLATVAVFVLWGKRLFVKS